MNVNIFDLQRGSLVDGPGVRTTVFFKGCNLSCKWCHNPESRSPARQMLFYRNRCAKCGRCLSACENGAVRDDFTVNRYKCSLCGKCVEVCHPEAKTICGYTVDTGEIFEKIKRDIPFFNDSGGGMTVSGGECMLQIEPLHELLKMCRNDGINTAVDTAGNVPFSSFEKILPVTDWFLYDLKHTDNEKHMAGTGAGNTRILQNLESLLHICPSRVIIRVPLIPGFNADGESVRAIAGWIASHPAPGAVEPLRYHAMGVPKSDALGEQSEEIEPLSKERFEKYRNILTKGKKL